MKKVIYKIDENGYLLFGNDNVIEENVKVPIGYIDTPLPTDLEGNQLPFYRPKWTGTKWIEDMTQEEIDELNNQPKKTTTEDYLLDLDLRVSMVELGLI